MGTFLLILPGVRDLGQKEGDIFGTTQQEGKTLYADRWPPDRPGEE
jgi:hypothetical protein